MGLEQQIGHPRSLHLLWAFGSEARLRVAPDVGVGPTIECTAFGADQEIGDQIIAKSVALLDDGPQLTGLGMYRKSAGISHSCNKRRLVAAIGVEALNGCLDFRLDPDIAGRSHADKKGAAFRVNG